MTQPKTGQIIQMADLHKIASNLTTRSA